MQPKPQLVPPHVTAATGTVALYLPWPQSRQLEAPGSITYLPAAQTVQAASAVAAIVAEYLPAGQSSQAGLVVGKVQNAVKPLFGSEESDVNSILI